MDLDSAAVFLEYLFGDEESEARAAHLLRGKEGVEYLLHVFRLYAEAGEPDKAREFIKGRKTVLLALTDRAFDKGALRYALNISKRIGAHLEILYVTESGKQRVGFDDFISEVEKEGFVFSLVMEKGCVKKAILGYTRKRREIQFVVVGSITELDTECRAEKTLVNAWEKLNCPLVVVSKGQAGSPA